MIVEEEHSELQAAVTKRKTILSGKWKVIDGKHILTTENILNSLLGAEKQTKKRKVTGAKKGNRSTSDVLEESSDQSEASQSQEVVLLDCIEVE